MIQRGKTDVQEIKNFPVPVYLINGKEKLNPGIGFGRILESAFGLFGGEGNLIGLQIDEIIVFGDHFAASAAAPVEFDHTVFDQSMLWLLRHPEILRIDLDPGKNDSGKQGIHDNGSAGGQICAKKDTAFPVGTVGYVLKFISKRFFNIHK